ncbi:DUF2288 domain-containing protein [Altericista sp. CCNU0014]|uniref:DUF2288 domain-containing protein n=1 Tax=Altericista sp. CCNU0014 TaxID=3082949 RepID=UPI00384E2C3F
MTSIQAQLARDLADVSWKDIVPHCQRDAVIVVHEGLSILEVGVAIAQDNVAQVQIWIEEQLLQKPTAQQLGLWNQSPDLLFSALIVQPYVLISAAVSG